MSILFKIIVRVPQSLYLLNLPKPIPYLYSWPSSTGQGGGASVANIINSRVDVSQILLSVPEIMNTSALAVVHGSLSTLY